VEFLRNLHEGQSKVEFPVELLFAKWSLRSICYGVGDGQSSYKKGKVIQMSNLPLKHGKGGLA